jgi:hypothetical protein
MDCAIVDHFDGQYLSTMVRFCPFDTFTVFTVISGHDSWWFAWARNLSEIRDHHLSLMPGVQNQESLRVFQLGLSKAFQNEGSSSHPDNRNAVQLMFSFLDADVGVALLKVLIKYNESLRNSIIMRIAPMNLDQDQKPNRGQPIEIIDPSDAISIRPVESSDFRHFSSIQAVK